MGGHGGLNILPQKRWNVYGRENRLKVKRDEEKAAIEQAEKDEVHQKAESEFRHLLLLKRAQAQTGAMDTTGELPGPEPDAEALQNAQKLRADGSARAESAPAENDAGGAIVPQAAASKAGGGAFDLLGFLETSDAKAEHPEVADEARKAAKKRGEVATQTSDAKFDAQFAFGHGLAGAANQPWYAKMGLQLLPVMGQAEQQQLPSGMAGITYETNSIPEKGERKHRGEPKDSKKQRKKEKSEKKEERRLQPKASRISKSDKSQKAAVLNALRREREAREAAERDKARLAVLQATKQIDRGPEGKRYHGSYGSKRRA